MSAKKKDMHKSGKAFSFVILLFSVFFTMPASSCLAQEQIVGKYNPVDLSKDKFFVNYFHKFKTLVKRNDKHGLSRMLENSYPDLLIVLAVKDSKNGKTFDIKIRNEKEFIKYYPVIFDERMRSFIERSSIADLNLMEGGLKLGYENVWWLYKPKKKEIRVSHLSNITIKAKS